MDTDEVKILKEIKINQLMGLQLFKELIKEIRRIQK